MSIVALLSTPMAFAAGLIVTGGEVIPGTSPSQGHAAFAAAGLFWERPLFHRASARLELFPIAVFRERERPVRFGESDRVDTVASAACALGRYVIVNSESPLFVEAGAGPFYAYRRAVPPGGTRGNFFDQIGVAWKRGAWEIHARYTHISNLNFSGRERNPGFSFAAVSLGWSFR